MATVVGHSVVLRVAYTPAGELESIAWREREDINDPAAYEDQLTEVCDLASWLDDGAARDAFDAARMRGRAPDADVAADGWRHVV